MHTTSKTPKTTTHDGIDSQPKPNTEPRMTQTTNNTSTDAHPAETLALLAHPLRAHTITLLYEHTTLTTTELAHLIADKQTDDDSTPDDYEAVLTALRHRHLPKFIDDEDIDQDIIRTNDDTLTAGSDLSSIVTAYQAFRNKLNE